MSGLLLDTNAVLWLVAEPDHLGPTSKALLASSTVWLSAASLWEAEIKVGTGKLGLEAELATTLAESGIRELPVRWSHTGAYPLVTLPHRDPFDRMLVAQAQVEGLTLLTADRLILSAGISLTHDVRT